MPIIAHKLPNELGTHKGNSVCANKPTIISTCQNFYPVLLGLKKLFVGKQFTVHVDTVISLCIRNVGRCQKVMFLSYGYSETGVLLLSLSILVASACL